MLLKFTLHSLVAGLRVAVPLVAAAGTVTAGPPVRPMLFMESRDLLSPSGKLRLVANEIQAMPELMPPKGLNYTGGDTITAAFPLEVFVAVGRPGEPMLSAQGTSRCLCSNTCPQGCNPDQGVKVQRFTTTDFKTWSAPVCVLYLPNGSGDNEDTDEGAEMGFRAYPGSREAARVGDGTIWTVKSMARTSATGEYLLAASYGSSVHTFRSAIPPAKESSFVPTTGSLKKSNFKDHDDVNLIYHAPSATWVDMQIMYENLTAVGLNRKKYKPYCDNIPIDTRRVVTVRTSKDGKQWSSDWGCLDAHQKSEHCKIFNTTAMVTADVDPNLDPPDLEFYRIRPFILGESGRLAAHVLDYVPSPPNVVYSPGYGRQPLWYCSKGCCHAPHMYEEWWIGPPSGNPTEMEEWRRPYRDTKAAPHDIWLMAQPVTTETAHVWVDNGAVWGLPLYRLAGVYSPGNGEFSTQPFKMPSTGKLWINAEATWGSWATDGTGPWQPGSTQKYDGNYVGGADEGRAAYIMVALMDAATGLVIPGHEPQRCLMTNVTGLRLPVTWGAMTVAKDAPPSPPPPPPVAVQPGQVVQLRFFFRDATIYAAGAV